MESALSRMSRTPSRSSADFSQRSRSTPYKRTMSRLGGRGIHGTGSTISRRGSVSNTDLSVQLRNNLCKSNFYTTVFGPTADESIFVGLRMFMSICKKGFDDVVIPKPPAEKRISHAQIGAAESFRSEYELEEKEDEEEPVYPDDEEVEFDEPQSVHGQTQTSIFPVVSSAHQTDPSYMDQDDYHEPVYDAEPGPSVLKGFSHPESEVQNYEYKPSYVQPFTGDPSTMTAAEQSYYSSTGQSLDPAQSRLDRVSYAPPSYYGVPSQMQPQMQPQMPPQVPPQMPPQIPPQIPPQMSCLGELSTTPCQSSKSTTFSLPCNSSDSSSQTTSEDSSSQTTSDESTSSTSLEAKHSHSPCHASHQTQRTSQVSCSPYRMNQNQSRIMQDPSRMMQDPSRIMQNPSRMMQDPSGMMQDPSRMVQDPIRMVQDPSHMTQDPSRMMQDTSCIMQEQSYMIQDPSRITQDPQASHLAQDPYYMSSHISQAPNRLSSLAPQDPSHMSFNPSHMTQDPSRMTAAQSHYSYHASTLTQPSHLNEQIYEHSALPVQHRPTVSYSPCEMPHYRTQDPSQIVEERSHFNNSSCCGPQSPQIASQHSPGIPESKTSRCSIFAPPQASFGHSVHGYSHINQEPSHVTQGQSRVSYPRSSVLSQNSQPSYMARQYPSVNTKPSHISLQPSLQDNSSDLSNCTTLDVSEAIASSSFNKDSFHPTKSNLKCGEHKTTTSSSTMTDQPNVKCSSTTTLDRISTYSNKSTSSEVCNCCSCQHSSRSKRKRSDMSTRSCSKKRRISKKSSEHSKKCKSSGSKRRRKSTHKKSHSSCSISSDTSRRSRKSTKTSCDYTTSTTMTDSSSRSRNKDAGDVATDDVRYAICKITKFASYTTFEVMRSTKRKPKFMPKRLEGVFVLRNKECYEPAHECVRTVVLGCS